MSEVVVSAIAFLAAVWFLVLAASAVLFAAYRIGRWFRGAPERWNCEYRSHRSYWQR